MEHTKVARPSSLVILMSIERRRKTKTGAAQASGTYIVYLATVSRERRRYKRMVLIELLSCATAGFVGPSAMDRDEPRFEDVRFGFTM
jgi:hypothetical protein